MKLEAAVDATDLRPLVSRCRAASLVVDFIRKHGAFDLAGAFSLDVKSLETVYERRLSYFIWNRILFREHLRVIVFLSGIYIGCPA